MFCCEMAVRLIAVGGSVDSLATGCAVALHDECGALLDFSEEALIGLGCFGPQEHEGRPLMPDAIRTMSKCG